MGPPCSLPSPIASGQTQADSDDDGTDLLSVSWNQDYSCFTAATNCDFRMYKCDPFGELLRRISTDKGFGIVEMLFQSNYFALVGGGASPQFPPNKVIIWDDNRNCCKEVLTFKSDVRAVKLRKDSIVVVLEHSLFVYGFDDVKLIRRIATTTNPRGLCCLSQYSDKCILACPGLQQGQVRVEHIALKTITFVAAHDTHIACIALTLDGLLLATASTKGTLIRIFNTKDGTRLQEVRRGIEKADIYSIAFSPNLQWLAVSSDRCTVHLYGLRVQEVGENASKHVFGEVLRMRHLNSSTFQDVLTCKNTGVNRYSTLSFMKGVLPCYFSSEWSFAQFRLPEATRYIVAFGAQDTVAIVGMNGSFYRCSFDPVNGGPMVQQEFVHFLKDREQGYTSI